MKSGRKDFALVTRHIRKMRGGSQPILAQASDGLLYVVKFNNNLQGANVPFNESIGTEIYRACALPSPSWKALLVTKSFIDQNPDCWMNTADGKLRPEPGLCFGSQFLGESEARTLEILPRSSLGRVLNKVDFWLAWLIDICAEHADRRQAIFVEAPEGWLDAFFIDHGHLFAGPKGRQTPHALAPCNLDLRIYQGLSSFHIFRRLNSLKSLDVDQLWETVVALPDDWKSVSAISGLGRCLGRLSRPTLLRSTLEKIIDYHGRNDKREHRKLAQPVLRLGV